MYCKYCGEQLPDGSVFCPACGNQLDSTYVGAPLKSKVSSSEVSPSGGPRFVKSTDPVRTQTEVGGYTYTKSSGTNWLPICLGIIIIIIIGFAVLIAAVALVFFPLVTQYSEPHLLDTREFALRADNGTINGLNLDFSVGVGMVSIETGDSSLTDHISIIQKVWTSRTDLTYDFSQVAGFHGTATAENITTLAFDSSEGHKDYYYELEVVVRSDIPLGLEIGTSAGLITFTSYEEITLTGLNLQTSVGAINVAFYETTYLDFTEGSIQSSAGELRLTAENFNMSQDCTLNTTASVGAVTLDITQTFDFGHTLNIYASTSTGMVDVNVQYGNTTGVSLITDTSASQVDINGLTNGFTDNYASATTYLDFTLKTSIGAIEFDAINA